MSGVCRDEYALAPLWVRVCTSLLLTPPLPPSPGFSRLFTLLLMRARSIAPQQIRLPCSKRLDAKGRISAWLTFVCVETGKRGGVHVRGRAGQLGVTCDQITGAR